MAQGCEATGLHECMPKVKAAFLILILVTGHRLQAYTASDFVSHSLPKYDDMQNTSKLNVADSTLRATSSDLCCL